MIVICDDANGTRLCQDGRFRMHAPFGTESNCVKEYRISGWAQRRCFQILARSSRESLTMRVVRIGETMDAAGRINKS